MEICIWLIKSFMVELWSSSGLGLSMKESKWTKIKIKIYFGKYLQMLWLQYYVSINYTNSTDSIKMQSSELYQHFESWHMKFSF